MTNKNNFCSACKHSRYVPFHGEKKLRCEQLVALGVNSYLDVDCTQATECLDFDPEQVERSYRDKTSYLTALRQCRIKPREARSGLLAHVGPQV